MKYIVRPYRLGEEKYVADAHKRIYSEEYHWGKVFTDYAMQIALEFAAKEPNDREAVLVAESEGKLIGCIMLCETETPTVGQLRMFLVEEKYRHYGIGTALTSSILRKAKEASFKELILWTASPLTAAIRNYEKLGFRFVEEKDNYEWSLDGQKLKEIKMCKYLE